jgi:hypothetical protein
MLHMMLHMMWLLLQESPALVLLHLHDIIAVGSWTGVDA